MRILVTGAAGFIGSNLIRHIFRTIDNATVAGIDNLNAYYDPRLKEERLDSLMGYDRFTFHKGNIANRAFLEGVFAEFRPQIVVNLAAQAGVRDSIVNPDTHIESNVIGFYNILEACRHSYEAFEGGVQHLVFASSSSVYGAEAKIPYSVNDKADSPVSLYAATKRSNELMAHAYSKLYNIPTTGLRFFTVYGQQDALIWHTSDLQTNSSKERRSRSSTTATARETSSTSTTSSRQSYAL